MKASKQCPKCDSLRVGYLERVHDQTVHDEASKSPWAYASKKVGVIESSGWLRSYEEGHGLLEAYLCADCGYYETYVKSPEDVPYEKLQGFHWLNPEPPEEGPYR